MSLTSKQAFLLKPEDYLAMNVKDFFTRERMNALGILPHTVTRLRTFVVDGFNPPPTLQEFIYDFPAKKSFNRFNTHQFGKKCFAAFVLTLKSVGISTKDYEEPLSLSEVSKQLGDVLKDHEKGVPIDPKTLRMIYARLGAITYFW